MFRPVHPKRVCLTLPSPSRRSSSRLLPRARQRRQIVNSSTWLELLATSGESGKGGNWVSVTTVVKHDRGVTIDQLQFDDDTWTAPLTPTSTKTNFTAQKMNVAGGADYTRISYRYQIPTSNTGMDDGFLLGTRRTDNCNLAVLFAVSNDGNSLVHAVEPAQVRLASGQCTGPEDFAEIWGQSSSATETTPVAASSSTTPATTPTAASPATETSRASATASAG